MLAGAAGAEVSGIALARIAADGELHTAAVGCARFAPDGRRCAHPLSPHTRFRVASLSKLITAVTVLRLVEAGRLRLDAPLAALLGPGPATSAAGQRSPTVAELLAHTSSLRDAAEPVPAATPLSEWMALAPRFDLAHPPGTSFHYANLNYVMAGAVVEKVTGQRFDVVAEREVLTPAGVVAGYGWDGAGAARPWGTPVRRRAIDGEWAPSGPWIAQVDATPEAPAVPADYVPGTRPQAFSPHGGLRISAADLARLLRAVLRGHGAAPPLLSPSSLAMLVGASGPAAAGSAGPCLLYTSPSPRDRTRSRMPSSA